MGICFSQAQLESIAAALGDTEDGLTGTEIGHLLTTCGMADPDPQLTKRHRLYNAFAKDQNERQDRTHVLGFRICRKHLLSVVLLSKFDTARRGNRCSRAGISIGR
jgi:hypothetical protein